MKIKILEILLRNLNLYLFTFKFRTELSNFAAFFFVTVSGPPDKMIPLISLFLTKFFVLLKLIISE